jgi:FMN reductase
MVSPALKQAANDLAGRVKLVKVNLDDSPQIGVCEPSALGTALEGSAAAGGESRLIWVRDLDLPLYNAELAIPPAAQEFADTVCAGDAMIWSTPTYHGSISGSFKNALD